jgi:hypothetical protein
MRWMWLKKT